MTNKNINILIAVVAVAIIGLLVWRVPRGGQPAVANPDNQLASPEASSTVISPTLPILPPVPVAATITVKAFFGNTKLNPNVADCTKVYAVTRTIPRTAAVGRAALEELFRGPTSAEAVQGFVTAINPGVTIQKLTIINGAASADFSGGLIDRAVGTCQASTTRAQITETLKQFPTVQSVTISIN